MPRAPRSAPPPSACVSLPDRAARIVSRRVELFIFQAVNTCMTLSSIKDGSRQAVEIIQRRRGLGALRAGQFADLLGLASLGMKNRDAGCGAFSSASWSALCGGLFLYSSGWLNWDAETGGLRQHALC